MGVRTGSRMALCLALALPFVGPSRTEAPEAPEAPPVAAHAPEAPPAAQAHEAELAAPTPRQQFLDQVRAQRQAQAESRRAVEEQRRQRRDAMSQHAESERAAIDLQRRAWPLGPPPPGWAPAAPAETQDGSARGWGGPWWSPPDPHPSGWSNPWYYRGW